MQKDVIATISANDYPDGLKRLHKPPKALNCKGDTNLVTDGPRAGIIGARKFTPYGKETTVMVASDLARSGITIVSGLALGVDSIAHRATIEAGGKTIAVLPSGINNIYPANHSQLAKNIVTTGGLLISEYENNFRPFKHSFIERNRIIAGLSDVLVITEAAVASGSLHTAYFALELGIPIFAVPGNINSPYSAGTNQLIRNGAHPLLDTSEILEMLGINQEDKLEYLPENEVEQRILEIIKSGITEVNEVLVATKMEIPLVQTYLTMLEIKGVISAEAGHWTYTN